MTGKALPDQTYLLQCFKYCPETGQLHWLYRPMEHFKNEHAQRVFNGKFSGKVAGARTIRGGIVVEIGNAPVRAHRIIWKLVNGEDPQNEIDHLNGNPEDNRWANLRLATSHQNKGNSKRRIDNSTGLKGVSFSASGERFIAYIGRSGRCHRYLGTFNNKADAHAAYCAAAKAQWGEFWSSGHREGLDND